MLSMTARFAGSDQEGGSRTVPPLPHMLPTWFLSAVAPVGLPDQAPEEQVAPPYHHVIPQQTSVPLELPSMHSFPIHATSSCASARGGAGE